MAKKISKNLLARMNYEELRELLLSMVRQNCEPEQIEEVSIFFEIKLRELMRRKNIKGNM